MHGEVKVWHMTEEERQGYIKKYPIKKEKPPSGMTYVTLEMQVMEKGRKRRKVEG